MGNSPAKETRPGEQAVSSSSRHHRASVAPSFDSSAGSSRDQQSGSSSRLRNRASRNDIGSLLGIGPAASHSRSSDTTHERRETKAEREARRLEREKVNRVKERERSLKEESIDGGYLVTMGVYVGPEDFSKQGVRQLQIERKLAPFWKGLNDFSETWTEYQIIAAARGLDIPLADQTVPEELVPRPASSCASPSASAQNLNSLTVPMGPRTLSTASDRSITYGDAAATGIASSKGAPSPFKPRSKALAAALSLGSRNGSSNELTPREINLPQDPFVKGQPLEVFLYKDGAECPICFLYYPPYLNHTRCCDQPICSECFVQIRRPDPHFPEGHDTQDNPENNPVAADILISEPAQCPYCQQPEFGVTYDPPPFRRGLTYAMSSVALGSVGAAMDSNTSLGSTWPPQLLSPPLSGSGTRRRTQSLSANAPNVITTDRVRPDWAAKLAAQRNHLARRAAAATALHTAAFLMGDSSGNRPFGRMSRFGRRNTTNTEDAGDSARAASSSPAGALPGPDPGLSSSSGRDLLRSPTTDRRRSHMENLENMMLAEAIRLSLAAEEERKRKVEKEERKEAKKKEKEERKAAKAVTKGQPYSGSGHSSAGGSTLSLPGLIGRRRGNSAASNLRVEATTAHAVASTGCSSPPLFTGPTNPNDKGKGVDRSSTQALTESEPAGAISTAPTATPLPISSPTGPSHLRQMSSVSSISSSLPDSQCGSFQNPPCLQYQDPHASGLSLSGKSNVSDDAGGRSGDDNESEPLFNFRSLAEMVGVELEGVNAGRRLSQIGETHGDEDCEAIPASCDNGDSRSYLQKASDEHVETTSNDDSVNSSHSERDQLDKSVATLTQDSPDKVIHGESAMEGSRSAPTPHLMITLDTPVVEEHEAGASRQPGLRGTNTTEFYGSDMRTQ